MWFHLSAAFVSEGAIKHVKHVCLHCVMTVSLLYETFIRRLALADTYLSYCCPRGNLRLRALLYSQRNATAGVTQVFFLLVC